MLNNEDVKDEFLSGIQETIIHHRVWPRIAYRHTWAGGEKLKGGKEKDDIFNYSM